MKSVIVMFPGGPAIRFDRGGKRPAIFSEHKAIAWRTISRSDAGKLLLALRRELRNSGIAWTHQRFIVGRA